MSAQPFSCGQTWGWDAASASSTSPSQTGKGPILRCSLEGTGIQEEKGPGTLSDPKTTAAERTTGSQNEYKPLKGVQGAFLGLNVSLGASP